MQGKIQVSAVILLAIAFSGCASKDVAKPVDQEFSRTLAAATARPKAEKPTQRHRIATPAAKGAKKETGTTTEAITPVPAAPVGLKSAETEGLKERTKDSVISVINDLNKPQPVVEEVVEPAVVLSDVPLIVQEPVAAVVQQSIPPLGLATQDWPNAEGEGFRFHATMVRKKLADGRPDLAGQEAKKAVSSATTDLEKVEANALVAASSVLMGRATGSVTKDMTGPISADWLAVEAARSGIVDTAPQVSVLDAVKEASKWPAATATLVVPSLAAASKNDAIAGASAEKLAERLNKSSNVDGSVVELAKGYTATALGDAAAAYGHFTKASSSKYLLVAARAKAEAKEAAVKAGVEVGVEDRKAVRQIEATPAPVQTSIPAQGSTEPAAVVVVPSAAPTVSAVTKAEEALLDPVSAAPSPAPSEPSKIQSAKEAIDSADALIESYKKEVK